MKFAFPIPIPDVYRIPPSRFMDKILRTLELTSTIYAELDTLTYVVDLDILISWWHTVPRVVQNFVYAL